MIWYYCSYLYILQDKNSFRIWGNLFLIFIDNNIAKLIIHKWHKSSPTFILDFNFFLSGLIIFILSIFLQVWFWPDIDRLFRLRETFKILLSDFLWIIPVKLLGILSFYYFTKPLIFFFFELLNYLPLYLISLSLIIFQRSGLKLLFFCYLPYQLVF